MGKKFSICFGRHFLLLSKFTKLLITLFGNFHSVNRPDLLIPCYFIHLTSLLYDFIEMADCWKLVFFSYELSNMSQDFDKHIHNVSNAANQLPEIFINNGLLFWHVWHNNCWMVIGIGVEIHFSTFPYFLRTLLLMLC